MPRSSLKFVSFLASEVSCSNEFHNPMVWCVWKSIFLTSFTFVSFVSSFFFLFHLFPSKDGNTETPDLFLHTINYFVPGLLPSKVKYFCKAENPSLLKFLLNQRGFLVCLIILLTSSVVVPPQARSDCTGHEQTQWKDDFTPEFTSEQAQANLTNKIVLNFTRNRASLNLIQIYKICLRQHHQYCIQYSRRGQTTDLCNSIIKLPLLFSNIIFFFCLPFYFHFFSLSCTLIRSLHWAAAMPMSFPWIDSINLESSKAH